MWNSGLWVEGTHTESQGGDDVFGVTEREGLIWRL